MRKAERMKPVLDDVRIQIIPAMSRLFPLRTREVTLCHSCSCMVAELKVFCVVEEDHLAERARQNFSSKPLFFFNLYVHGAVNKA